MAQSGFLSRLFNRPKDEVVKIYEPTPRYCHCAVSLGGQVYCFAGRTADFGKDKRSLSTHMEVFDPIVETWVQRETVGHPPGGLYDGAIAASHSHLYHYGGHDGSSYHGNLSKFCPATLLWTRVSQHSADGPMKKEECDMICCGDILGLFGGHDDGGCTDEFHLFDITKGLWSSPATTGTRPTPRANFSFTEIDDHRGILFAGLHQGFVRTNDTYLMDLQLKEWSKLDLVDGGLVPVERYAHAACCINVGEDHPLLLVTGGLDKDGRVLKDAWLLDIVARRWKELTVPEDFKPRYNHSLTATSLAPGITVATAFGGWREVLGDLIAETTLLQFEHSADSPSPKWSLTDVVLNGQRGSEDRVRDKRMKIEAAVARQQRRMTPQPQTTSLSDESHTFRETQALQASQERERVLEQRAQEAERMRREAEQRERALQQRLREAENQVQEAERQKHMFRQRAMEAEATTQNALQATDNANRRTQEVTQQLEGRVVELQASSERIRQMETENERNQQGVDRMIQSLRRRAEAAELRARDQETQWVVQRGEIQLTEEEKGRGGWAVVRVANFRGLRVAAKCLHEQIRAYYRDLFIREMNMAARLRHPNLVQFVGATLQGEMIILTELMPTSLRAVLEERAISHNEITSISLDVARALNYLHLTQPEPLIHRDISSANVLLEPGPNNSWKAKVSDYGSVNLQRQLRTVGPGSPVYAAPEANYPDQQSPKMDIFSFGVLLIEMCTARFPEVAARQNLIDSIEYPHFVELIGRCMSREIGSRPSASEIITELSQLRQP